MYIFKKFYANSPIGRRQAGGEGTLHWTKDYFVNGQIQLQIFHIFGIFLNFWGNYNQIMKSHFSNLKQKEAEKSIMNSLFFSQHVYKHQFWPTVMFCWSLPSVQVTGERRVANYSFNSGGKLNLTSCQIKKCMNCLG